MNPRKEDCPQRIIRLSDAGKRLETLGSIRQLPADTPFICAGEVLPCCYYIKTGAVVAAEINANGVEHEYHIMEENSLIGDPFLLSDRPCPISFRTIRETQLICIEKDALLSALDSDPKLGRLVIESLSAKFLSAMDELRQTHSHNATWRVCNLLILFADQYGREYDGKILIGERISQQMMSSLLSINRTTTVRIVKTLKEMRLIEQINGLYCIRDLDRLKAYQEANSGRS